MLRFTIRDLLWLAAVVAMAVAWWIERRHLISQLNSVTEAEMKTIGTSLVGHRLDVFGYVLVFWLLHTSDLLNIA